MKNKNTENKTVMDVFCGAGGFSAGFFQNGYSIVLGVDNWQPAMDTFNFNYGLDCDVKNVLDFEESIEQIENLPDVSIIIGSPPCVSFSNSNKSGKADKSMGVRLTETFLRIVAVKKYSKDSVLEAWFMENVTNSANYLNDYYTFKDLNLSDWAERLGYSKNDIAIKIKEHCQILISSDYGCPQVRRRLITSENILTTKPVIPQITHSEEPKSKGLKKWITIGDVLGTLPPPNSPKSNKEICDPINPKVKLQLDNLTDHFYDSGLYKMHWEQSKYLKTNHPFMGKMSFPEKMSRPSRTLTATNIGTSREAIIYPSEYSRIGDGEFRIPTIREMACLMGFPITYQFVGKSNAKKRLVGNAVCPTLSKALSKQLAIEFGIDCKNRQFSVDSVKLVSITNLNTFSPKKFNSHPQRNPGARFRRHPFKLGNITVTLSNYRIGDSKITSTQWQTSIQYGNGKGYPNQEIPDNYYKEIEELISSLENGSAFVQFVNNGFSERIPGKQTLQRLYEQNLNETDYLGPIQLIELVRKKIDSLEFEQELFEQTEELIFKHKSDIPIKQLFALYAVNKISTTSNLY